MNTTNNSSNNKSNNKSNNDNNESNTSLNKMTSNIQSNIVDTTTNMVSNIKKTLFTKETQLQKDKKLLYKKVDQYFKKEDKYILNRLAIYYNFEPKFSHIFSIPHYIYLFLWNKDFVLNCSYEWEKIVDLYKSILRRDKTFKYSRMKELKNVWERESVLFWTYQIISLFILLGSIQFYGMFTKLFNYSVDSVNKVAPREIHDLNIKIIFAFYLFIVVGLYYYGIAFIIAFIISFGKAAYFILYIFMILLYYILVAFLTIIYYFFLGLYYVYIFLFNPRTFTGGSNLDKYEKTIIPNGSDFINDTYNNTIYSIRKTFYDIFSSRKETVSFLDTVAFNATYYLERSKGTCNNNRLEAILAEYNAKRKTDVPVDLNKELYKEFKSRIPDHLKNSKIVKCMNNKYKNKDVNTEILKKNKNNKCTKYVKNKN